MDLIDAHDRAARAARGSPREDSGRLPPGQRRTDDFLRFGKHLHQPAPDVPADPRIRVVGVAGGELVISLAELATMPRRRLTADFHCVAGWSAIDLHWEGVAFETFYRLVVAPALADGAPVSHLVFGGLDGYQSIVCIEDALADGVLLADMLGGQPLDSDHGAPLRLVSPGQYGFVSTKHLCRIALHTSRPPEPSRSLADRLLMAHPRARVWHEERHGRLPAWAVRDVYRLLIPPIRYLSARGGRQQGPRRASATDHPVTTPTEGHPPFAGPSPEATNPW